jgi:hypothetical protein
MPSENELRWARRVQQDLIRRLYALDAKGIEDEELVNEAGYAMYARCESIRIGASRGGRRLVLVFVAPGESQPDDDGQHHPAIDEAQPEADGDHSSSSHNPSGRLLS